MLPRETKKEIETNVKNLQWYHVLYIRQNFSKFWRKLRTRWLTLGFFDLTFVLFSAQELFALMYAIVVFETFGLFGVLLILVALLSALAFDRLLGRTLARMLRKHLALFFYLVFQISLFGLIGTIHLGLANVPAQTIYASLGFGLWASIACSLQSYHTVVSFQKMQQLGLDYIGLNETFLQLPDSFQTNDDVVQGYGTALYVIPLLFSSHEYLFAVITIGNIIQNLLNAVDDSVGVGPTTKAKRIGLNVSFEELTVKGRSQCFDIKYFWHDVRSKYAHVTTLSRYGIKEPSEEITRKSAGLLCAFLKAYPACVARVRNHSTT